MEFQLAPLPGEDYYGIEIAEYRNDRGVRQVIRRNIDRLYCGDRPSLHRSYPLLEGAHLRSERRLVTCLRRDQAEERRYLRAGLDEPVDIIYEEEHVVILLLQILRQRYARIRYAEFRRGRFVHLAEREHDLVQHILFFKFQ